MRTKLQCQEKRKAMRNPEVEGVLTSFRQIRQTSFTLCEGHHTDFWVGKYWQAPRHMLHTALNKQTGNTDVGP